MKLSELKKIIDSYHSDLVDPDVMVALNQPSSPRRAMTEVEYACYGFDWEHGLFIITTADQIVTKKPTL